MKASELRIGNWVNSIAGGLRGGYGIVRGIEGEGALIMLKQGHLKPLASEVLCGISLTEEILLKCGFETEDDQFTGIELPYYSLPGTPYFFHKGDLNELLHDEFGRFSINVQNLHSIQNVIFSLTGKELTIELC